MKHRPADCMPGPTRNRSVAAGPASTGPGSAPTTSARVRRMTPDQQPIVIAIVRHHLTGPPLAFACRWAAGRWARQHG